VKGVFHDEVLYAIEFQFADGTKMLSGSIHPLAKSTHVQLNPDSGERLTGFAVCSADKWVDAIKVLTNKKESPWMGNTKSWRLFWLRPPQGYEVVGICGEQSGWYRRDSFGVVYTSNP
jgi:hypothetical protein